MQERMSTKTLLRRRKIKQLAEDILALSLSFPLPGQSYFGEKSRKRLLPDEFLGSR